MIIEPARAGSTVAAALRRCCEYCGLLPALVEDGRRGVVLVVEVERVVVALDESRVAHDGEVAWHLALEMHLEGAAVALPIENGARRHTGFNVLARDLDQQILAPGSIPLASLILGVGSHNREVVVAKDRRQRGCQHGHDRRAANDGIEHNAPPWLSPGPKTDSKPKGSPKGPRF